MPSDKFHSIKKNLFSINRDELLFDILLFVYVEFFLYSMVTGGKWFIQILSVNTLFTLGVVIDFFIIWYLGIIYSRYRKNTENFSIRILVVLISFWIVISLHFGIAFNIFDIYGKPDIIVLAVFGYLLVMVGIGGGTVFAFTEAYKSMGKPVIADRWNAIKKLLPIGMIAMNVYIAYQIVDALHVKNFFLGFFIWALLGFIEFYIPSIIEKEYANGKKQNQFRMNLFSSNSSSP